jgi:membrane fusion protein (multidrug efflux system)
MAKRFFIVLLLMAALIGGLAFVKYRQVEAAIAMGASFQMPPTSVTTVVAKRETWPSTLAVIGTAAAVQGVTVGADLPGVVEKIHFESGQTVHQGDVLVELDIRQEKSQLATIEAQRDLAHVQFGRSEELSKAGVISKSDYDNAASLQKTTEAQVSEVKSTIARKTIHAPFTGVLGLRQISVGQYLAAGQAIVTLESRNPIYVNFGVPQQDTPKMKLGRSVRVTSTDLPGVKFGGKITALDSIINEQTRNIQIQATLENPGGKLRPGMYLDVELPLGESRDVIPLPASAINYAPSGDSVFVVGDMKDEKTGKSYKGVRQQIVKIEGTKGDQVAIVSGLNPGDEVVSAGAFRLRNAAPVLVNNSVQPSNSPKPNPEES